MSEANNKVALVTGASRGIGAAIAERLGKDGFTVIVNYAGSAGAAEAVVRKIEQAGGKAIAAQADVADAEAVRRMFDSAEAAFGGVDVLVNNAGIPKRRTVQALTPEIVESTMAINYYSPIRLTLALLATLIERDGHIVNISSIAARLGPPGEAAYAATKAALTAWSESMAVDLRDTNVGVHVVNPAVIDTELFQMPDNDAAMIEDVDALPTDAMVEPVLRALDEGTFEVYVPEHFQQITQGPFNDPTAWIEGTKAYARSRD